MVQSRLREALKKPWMPAFAGMTPKVLLQSRLSYISVADALPNP